MKRHVEGKFWVVNWIHLVRSSLCSAFYSLAVWIYIINFEREKSKVNWIVSHKNYLEMDSVKSTEWENLEIKNDKGNLIVSSWRWNLEVKF